MTGLHIVALLIAIAASVSDLRTRRIPNALTFAAAAAGIAVGSIAGGVPGLMMSTAGCALGIALLLPVFMLRGMGGGDVKLLAALGAWLGPGAIVSVALYTAIAGAALAVGLVIAERCWVRVVDNLRGLVTFWCVAGVQPMPALTLETAPGPRLPYAVPMTIGLVVTLWLR